MQEIRITIMVVASSVMELERKIHIKDKRVELFLGSKTREVRFFQTVQ